MKTDRELLELAAKAAGLRIESEPFADGERLRASMDGHWWPVWNPLTDDGDALRLAVALRMYVYQSGVYSCVSCCAGGFVEDHSTDPNAATRRAIVRAAAEIGANK
jgi:hypothetical protein